jgi:hypothetical protein
MSLTISTNTQWQWIPSRATFLIHTHKRDRIRDVAESFASPP